MKLKVSIKKFFSYAMVLILLFSSSHSIVSAEVNAEKLAEILSKLSGDDVTLSGTTNTGTTTEPKTDTGTEVEETKPEEDLKSAPEEETGTNVEDTGFDETNTPAESAPTPNPIIKTPTETKASIKILKIANGDKMVTFTWRVDNEPSELKKFAFTYTSDAGKKNTVMTYDKSKIKKANGDYSWYISNLELTRYVVTISGVDASGNEIPSLASKTTTADLSLGSAGKCVIPNVTGLKLLTKKEGSVLYWNKIPEAIGYNVYLRNTNGKFNFIEKTKKNYYNITMSKSSVGSEEFSVKAICADSTESAKFVLSTRVRTGPQEIIIGVLALVISFFIVKRKKLFPGKI